MGTDKPARRGPETLRVGFNANPAQALILVEVGDTIAA
jgi:hypothetical protein